MNGVGFGKKQQKEWKRTVTGQVVSGVLRGKSLIHKFRYRFVSILGFEPYEGTLDVELKFPLLIKNYATKRIEHVLMDGSRHIDAYIAPVTLHVRKVGEEKEEEKKKQDFSKKDMRDRIDDLKEDQKILKERVEQMEGIAKEDVITHDSFAMQMAEPINPRVIELLDKERLRDKLGVKEGDLIDITFYIPQKERKKSRFDFLKKG